jgi:hypothetical protein
MTWCGACITAATRSFLSVSCVIASQRSAKASQQRASQLKQYEQVFRFVRTAVTGQESEYFNVSDTGRVPIGEQQMHTCVKCWLQCCLDGRVCSVQVVTRTGPTP